jgi:hypothetical protein
MEADKLKKKLNGSILKGKKLKVEAARDDPSKKKTKTDDDAAETSTKPERTSKRKAEDSVLDGYELPADRKVKRGWTEPAGAKKFKKLTKAEKEARVSKPQSKSKYTEKAECLFKTKTPPNKTSDAASKKAAKSKKLKAPNEVVVHEFSQTVSHPSFLKSTTGSKLVTAGFEEGKGWVDQDGNVQQPESKKVRTAEYHPGKRDGAKERAVKKRKKSPSPVDVSEKEDQDSDWTSSSGPSDSESSDSESDADSDSDLDASSSSDASSVSRHEKEDSVSDTQVDKPAVEKNATVESDAQSDDSSSEDNEDGEDDQSDSDDDSSEADSETPLPASKATEDTAEAKDVHPLEALFKRAGPDEKLSLDTSNTFSFFTGNDDDIEDEEEAPPQSLGPLTPYTKRDRQIRDMRSGAPTPDTAVFPRHKLLLAQSDKDEDEDEDMDDAEDGYAHGQAPEATPSKIRVASSSDQQPEESDFVKWFWEHRGENNRAWKRRRREVAKDKRQRENRRKGMKGRG